MLVDKDTRADAVHQQLMARLESASTAHAANVSTLQHEIAQLRAEMSTLTAVKEASQAQFELMFEDVSVMQASAEGLTAALAAKELQCADLQRDIEALHQQQLHPSTDEAALHIAALQTEAAAVTATHRQQLSAMEMGVAGANQSLQAARAELQRAVHQHSASTKTLQQAAVEHTHQLQVAHAELAVQCQHRDELVQIQARLEAELHDLAAQHGQCAITLRTRDDMIRDLQAQALVLAAARTHVPAPHDPAQCDADVQTSELVARHAADEQQWCRQMHALQTHNSALQAKLTAATQLHVPLTQLRQQLHALRACVVPVPSVPLEDIRAAVTALRARDLRVAADTQHQLTSRIAELEMQLQRARQHVPADIPNVIHPRSCQSSA